MLSLVVRTDGGGGACGTSNDDKEAHTSESRVIPFHLSRHHVYQGCPEVGHAEPQQELAGWPLPCGLVPEPARLAGGGARGLAGVCLAEVRGGG